MERHFFKNACAIAFGLSEAFVKDQSNAFVSTSPRLTQRVCFANGAGDTFAEGGEKENEPVLSTFPSLPPTPFYPPGKSGGREKDIKEGGRKV